MFTLFKQNLLIDENLIRYYQYTLFKIKLVGSFFLTFLLVKNVKNENSINFVKNYRLRNFFVFSAEKGFLYFSQNCKCNLISTQS